MAQSAQGARTATPTPTTDKPTITPEERAARREESQTKRLRRDVVRGLDSAQTCLRRASAAVTLGDMAKFGQWIDAAEQAMTTAHSLAAALSESAGTPAVE